jgi:hypothetical protein
MDLKGSGRSLINVLRICLKGLRLKLKTSVWPDRQTDRHIEILLKIGVTFSQLFLTIYLKKVINFQRGSEQ